MASGQRAKFKGFSYPFRKGESAFPEPAYDGELVKASLRQIVRTRRGERVFRPRYGADAELLIFENNSPSFAARAAREIATAISESEPRIRLSDVLVERGEEDLTITVEYEMAGRPQTLRIEGVR